MHFRVLFGALIIHSCFVNCHIKSKLSCSLLKRLKDEETPNILISFVSGVDHVLKSTRSLRYQDANTKAQALYESLFANSKKSQNSVVQLLVSSKINNISEIEFKTFWITNELVVDDATLQLVEQIAEHTSVSFITEEPVEKLVPDYRQWAAFTKYAAKQPQNSSQWNIEKIQAPQAWEHMNGNKGDGIVIGLLDSGVRSTHETLQNNFLGEYGWFDPVEGTNLPFDDMKHGTACAGIAVGSNGIGVAPNAKWSACKGCNFGKCERKHVLACAQFFACPTLTDGSKPDCSKRPHIISNSWFAADGSNYSDMIKMWRELGIIPVFAVGNGYSCCPMKHPANLSEVIAVGNTMKNDDLARDSCIGREKNLTIVKPDVVAPGYKITSANSAADNAYINLSGTSMACPHVAGVIALILSNNVNMSFEEIRNILISNTDQNYNGSECSSVKPLDYPNAYYGYGRVNAYNSVKAIDVKNG